MVWAGVFSHMRLGKCERGGERAGWNESGGAHYSENTGTFMLAVSRTAPFVVRGGLQMWFIALSVPEVGEG